MANTTSISSGDLSPITQSVRAHGSVGIENETPIPIHGTVDIQSDVTIGTVNIAGTIETHVNSGSIDINNMPAIHGTVDLYGDVVIGTVSILGTVEGHINSGSVDSRAVGGSVGVSSIPSISG
jgi:hypothetical protein